jgi:crotonobetainyl-CoA:carnitine CoA-transferase CaiB-like acyl-CoA transferase
MRPLEGITVVSLEHAIAAPFATRQLADLGARVIKVERPMVGDFARNYDTRARGLSSHFVWTNRSKESLCLDLKDVAQLAILKQLILEKADVVVQNLAPGAASRMGLGFEVLHAVKPSLIVCDISGYGGGQQQDPNYADKKAYDLLIQSEAGFVSTTGSPDAMAKAGISIADIAAGMYAYTNILAALIERDKTKSIEQPAGIGRHIDLSMLEAMTEWMGFPLYYALDGQTPPPRAGASHATIFPYGSFDVGHEINQPATIMLGLQNEREWQVFCEQVLLQPAIAKDSRFDSNPKRSSARAALRSEIDAVFALLTIDQVVTRLEAAGIGNAQVRDMAALWAHPQLAVRSAWTTVASTAGELPALWPVGRRNAQDARMDAIPAIGEHTDAILAELGYPRTRSN